MIFFPVYTARVLEREGLIATDRSLSSTFTNAASLSTLAHAPQP